MMRSPEEKRSKHNGLANRVLCALFVSHRSVNQSPFPMSSPLDKALTFVCFRCPREAAAQSPGEDPVGDGCGDGSGGGYLEMAYKEMAVVEDEIASGKRK